MHVCERKRGGHLDGGMFSHLFRIRQHAADVVGVGRVVDVPTC